MIKLTNEEENKTEESKLHIKGDEITIGTLTPEEEKEEQIFKNAKKHFKLWYGINTLLLLILLIIVVYAWYSGYYCKYTIDLRPNLITNVTEGIINLTSIPLINP